MTTPDSLFYERVVRRITGITGMLGSAGTIVALAAGGWRWAAGFALGGLVSWISFRIRKQAVDALGVERPPSKPAAKAAMSYPVIGVGVYLITKYLGASLHAMLGGLFLSTAAVLVEILIELVYARG